MGETTGQPGERIAVDLVRRPGAGPADEVERLDDVLAPVARAGRRPRRAERRRVGGGPR